MTADKLDVLIVGAGPSGLLLAGDLAAAGVPVTVLERRRGAPSGARMSRACPIQARTLELLDARGLADELIAAGHTITGLHLPGRMDIDLSALPSRFGFMLVSPQHEIERLLAERARSLGALIVGGMAVTGLRPANEGAHVQARGAAGKSRTFTPTFVVGAGGARSTVRDLISVPFPRAAVPRSALLADVRLTTAPPDVVMVSATQAGVGIIAPFGDGWYRIVAWNRRRQVPAAVPVNLGEIRHLVRQTFGCDFGIHDPRWLARCQDDERQVPRYRSGPVFLVGDAAHVHSPVGGQGMNLALQDAANLSWKLAAVASRSALPSLLDSYHDERRPAGVQARRLSDALFGRVVTGVDLIRHPITDARRPGAMARASGVPLGERISGLALGYRGGRGAHLLAGRRAPDVALADCGRSRLYEALQEGKFVLVADGSVPIAGPVAMWHGRLLTATQPAGPTTARLTLVRPDGYVAWASDETNAARRDETLRSALLQWCGPPSDHARAVSYQTVRCR